MPVNYREYRDSVETLFDSVNEIDRRNAISRSYYAVYHHARELEATFQIKDHRRIEGKGMHIQLASKFTRVIDQPHLSDEVMRSIRRLGTMLNAGRALRQKADYQIEDTISKEDAEYHKKNMDNFHQLAEQVMASS